MKWAYILALIIVLGSVKADVDLNTSNNQNVTGNTKVTSRLGNMLAVIGDDTNSTFNPNLKLSRRYFEDSNFSILWNMNIPSTGNTNVVIENKIVKYKRNSFELWFYQLKDSPEMQDGGFEFMAKINAKPAVNFITFKINAPNLLFYYQPPLNEEQEYKAANYTCNATLCMNGTTFIAERPLNVVGSYAVYHAFKTNNEYQVGKVMHIYRPFVNDSNGVISWANLTIIGTTVTISADANYLNNAAYPIYIDPTFGYTTGGTTGFGLGTPMTARYNRNVSTVLNVTCGDAILNYSFYGRTNSGSAMVLNFTVYNTTPGGTFSPVPSIRLFSSSQAWATTVVHASTPAWATSNNVYQNLTPYTSNNITIAFGDYANTSAAGLAYGDVIVGAAHSRSNLAILASPAVVAANSTTKLSLYATYNNTPCTVSPSFNPSFDVRIGFPLNGTTFTYGYNFTAFYNITGNGTNYDTKWNLDGGANRTTANVLNYTNTTQWVGILSAGQHNITICGTNSSVTNCSTTFFQVNRTGNPIYLHLDKAIQNLTVTYGATTNATGWDDISEGSLILYRNGTSTANPEIAKLGAGVWNYTLYFAQTENYTENVSTLFLHVNKSVQFCNATIDGVWQNKTITYGTSATGNGSSSNVTGGLLYRNDTSVAYPESGVYGAGVWNYTFSSLGNVNYTSCYQTVFLTVNKATPSLSVTLAPSDTVIYPKQTTATGVGCPSQITCTLNKDGIAVGNPDINSFGVGTYNYVYNTSGNINYTTASGSNLLTVNQNTTWWLNITISPSATVTYGTQTTLTGIWCPAELTCNLFRDAVGLSNPDVRTLGVGVYTYVYNTTGNANYAKASASQIVTVNKYSQTCTMLIDGVDSDKVVSTGTVTNATGVATNVSGTLYRNATGVANPEVGAIGVGVWNYTIISLGDSNYTSCSATRWLNVTANADVTPPQINTTSPLNQSYDQCSYDLTLNATANETISIWWYQLNNNGVNNSFTPPISITVINGSNYVQVWANDTAGNIGYNQTYFTLNYSCAPSVNGSGGGGCDAVFAINEAMFQQSNTTDEWIKYLLVAAVILLGFNLFKDYKGPS